MCTYTISTEPSAKNKYQCDLFWYNPDGLNNSVVIRGNHLTSNNDTSVLSVKAVSGISKNVPSSICNQFPNAQYFTLRDMNIEFFTLTNCNKVTDIDMRLNSIKELPSDLCKDQPLLSKLFLEYNQIQVVTGDSLKSCTNLRYLYLEYNQLSEISSAIFANKPLVYDIRLGFNKIKTFDESTFHGLNNLDVLVLRYNAINYIPPKAFTSLTKLRWLMVESNLLTTLSPEWFTDLMALTTLYFNANPIVTFPPSTFKPLTSLVSLQLFSCKMTTIDSEWFSSLPSLYSVDLNSNLITEIPLGSFNGSTKFSVLKIQNNKLKRIDSKSFSAQNLPNLSVIDLSKNQITAVDRLLLDQPMKLVTFNFAGNLCENRNIINFYESKETNMAYFNACFLNFAAVTV